jgi:hypothetical protein
MPADSPAPERPRQVTLAAWLIVIGSVLVVLSAFERMSGLHSLETQEAISDFLSQPPGDGLGLTHDGAQSLLRVLALVGGGAAAAAAILGHQVLSRSRSARVALTVLALPLFVGGLAVFGFVSALVVVSVVMLWLQPAKDWFDGVTPAPPPARVVGTVAGTTPGRPFQTPGPPPPLPSRGYPPATRPASMTGACIITWVACGLALCVMGLTVLVLAATPDLVFDEVKRQDPGFDMGGLSEDEVRRAAFIGCGIAGVWCLAAIGFAVAAFQGLRWGWVAMLASTAAAGVASTLLMVGSLVMVAPLAASAVTVGLLLRPESRTWCRRTTRRRGSVSP